MKRLGTESEAAAAKASAAFRKSQSALYSTGRAATAVGRMMTGAGLVMAGIGYVSAKSAITFQQSMTRIHTQAGVATGSVNAMSKAVLNYAQSGKSQAGPNDLANALYHIASVGIHQTVPAMNALKVAQEGAAVGGSDLEDTASALAGAMVATHAKAGQLNSLMGLLNATVGAGNMRMSDLVTGLGRGIVPAFQAVGLNIKDALGALDVFTDAGIPAASAASQVSTALHYLYDPTTKAQKALATIGMTSNQMANDLHSPQGLLVAMRDLKSNLDRLPGGATGVDATQILGDILPGGRGRIMLTLIQNLGRYQNKLNQINKQSGQFASDVAAQHQTMAAKLHEAWSQIQADMVKFGSTLLPIIARYLPMFVGAITGLLKVFASLHGGVGKVLTIMTLAFLVGGPIIMGIGKMITLVARLRDMWRAVSIWAGRAGTTEEGAGAASAAGAAAGAGVGAGATAATRAAATARGAASVEAAATGAVPAVAGVSRLAMLGDMINPLLAVGSIGYMLAASGAGGPLRPGEAPVGYTPGTNAGGRAAGLGGGFANNRTKYAAGGYVKGPGGVDNVAAWLSAGEGVLNQAAMSKIGVGGLNAMNSGSGIGAGGSQGEPIQINNNMYIDSRLVAQSVTRAVIRKAARGPSSLVGGQIVTGS